MREKILLVDDEEKVATSLKMALQENYEVHLAHSGKVGLQKLADFGPFAVVVADLKMPEMDGVEFLQKALEQAPLTVRMVLTGYADIKSAIELVNKGKIFRFHTKPSPANDVKFAIDAAVEQYRLLIVEKDLLNRTVRGTVEVLTDIMSLLDPVEFSQTSQKRELVIEMCANLGVREPLNVVLATMLSSIGAATIPAPVLLRIRLSEELSDTDNAILNRMCEVGADLLQKIPRLEKVAQIIRYQRASDKAVGTDGGPDDEVPKGARILRIVNDFVRQITNGLTELDALSSLEKQAHLYDGEVLNVLQKKLNTRSGQKSTKEEFRLISPADLALGHTLARDVMTVDGVLVAPANTVIGESALTKLVNYGKLIGLVEPLYVYMPGAV